MMKYLGFGDYLDVGGWGKKEILRMMWKFLVLDKYVDGSIN